MLDLTAIKARRNYSYSNRATPLLAAISDIDALLLEIERLTASLTAKDRVLSQFADSANWVGANSFLWSGAVNPIELANQALSEGKE